MQYKKIIVWIVLLSCIIAGTMDIINIKPGQAGRSMLVLYFCIPLVSLALTDSSKSYIKIGGVIVTLLLLAISRFQVYPIIGAAIFVGGSLFSLLRHNTLLQRRKQITPWGLAIVHSGIFAMVCAIAGSFSIMGKGNQFDVTCEEVRGYINQHMSTVLTPLGITTGQMDNIQLWVDGFFTKSTEEVTQDLVTNQLGSMAGVNPELTQQITQQLGGKSISEITALIKNSPQGTQQLGGKSALEIAELLKKSTQGGQGSEQASAQIAALLQSTSNTLEIKTPDPSTLASNNPIAKKLQDRARNKLLLSATVGDKQELDDKICNVVFDQIRTRSTLPGFTLSILISLIFFFYPLIRLFTYFYAGFLSIVYMLLRQTGFISVVPEEKIVETWLVGDGYTGNTLLSTLAFQSKVTAQVAKQSPAQIAQNAIPPMPSTKNTGGNDINDVLGSFEPQGGFDGGTNKDHIITANSPQDTDEIDIPPTPKKDNSPHIDFGSFGGNFDKKVKKKNNIDDM